MDCSNTQLTVAKSIVLNSDQQWEQVYEYHYGDEEAKKTKDDQSDGKRRMLDGGAEAAEQAKIDAEAAAAKAKATENVVAADWKSIFTSNKAKPDDCAPTSCTVHKTTCASPVLTTLSAPDFKWKSS
jgi:hypothetical protein